MNNMIYPSLNQNVDRSGRNVNHYPTLEVEMVICQEIRKVKNGYILELRWPFGGEPMGYGEVICTDWGKVIELLTRAANEEDFKYPILTSQDDK